MIYSAASFACDPSRLEQVWSPGAADPEVLESLPHAQITLTLLCCCHRCVSGLLKCWPSACPRDIC